jgi:aminopeptidase N
LKALREEIGDQAFFGALTEYYRQYKYDVADAATLLEIFEHQSGRSLDDFYQEWLYYAEK